MSFADVIRREFKISDDERDRGLVTPDDVVRFDDICYVDESGQAGVAFKEADADVKAVFSGDDAATDDGFISRWNYLDVYRPKTAEGRKLPVIVNVHGGGWVYGDKEVYQFYCMNLCQRGFAVVNASYRLAPVFKFPAQLKDINDVFTWTINNAERYGFDNGRIYAVGDSAGANLLGLYCVCCTDSEYASGFDFVIPKIDRKITTDGHVSKVQFVPRAVALNCGAYDIEVNQREMKGFMKELMPERGTEKELELLRVTDKVNKDFPPSFVMTCYGDFLKEQEPYMTKALKAAGVQCISRVYGSDEHPLKHVFNCDIRMDEAKLCNDEECRFFKSL